MLEESELRSAIEFQAQDYIPIPIEEAVFDFHITERVTGEDGVEKLKVLVVAAQKAMVMDFINAVKKAKLNVAGIDLQAFAMLRSLAPKAALELGGGAEAHRRSEHRLGRHKCSRLRSGRTAVHEDNFFWRRQFHARRFRIQGHQF